MKQIKNLAWMSAIALAGTMTFAACSSDDDKVENINPTYDGKSVKTQFAINIPRAAQTRQTVEITQNNSNFRGMTDIKLIPLTGTANSESAINRIALGDIATSEINDENGQKTYQDVDIATGTSHFLFYGKAIKEQAATNAQNGILESNLSTASKAKEIAFSLDKIYEGNLTDASLLTILNNIVGIKAWQNSVNASLQTALSDIEGLIAGSSYSILKAVEKLYNAIVGRADENAEEGTTGYIANLIKVEIEKYFTPTSAGSSSYTLAYEESFEEDEENITINKNFPADKKLPEGAARLTCTNHTFTYALTAIGSTENVSINSIAYPAELYYFANTPLKANKSANAVFDWTTGTWRDWTNTVAATTRLIALQNKINYGVALLNTTIKLNGTSLNDRKETSIDVEDNLKFTGILIGGQPAKVGWNFEPTEGETFATTIYDNDMNNSNDALSSTAITNYTMVLDNYGSKGVAGNDGAAALNNSVNIAIELENNTGVEFHGVDGVVPDGGKFYLVAKLDPTSPKTAIAGVDRVFLQDYTTTANLTITSLKNAYVTIPDLRATQLNLGLYVDLSWKTGLTFDVNIGGDNQ